MCFCFVSSALSGVDIQPCCTYVMTMKEGLLCTHLIRKVGKRSETTCLIIRNMLSLMNSCVFKVNLQSTNYLRLSDKQSSGVKVQYLSRSNVTTINTMHQFGFYFFHVHSSSRKWTVTKLCKYIFIPDTSKLKLWEKS